MRTPRAITSTAFADKVQLPKPSMLLPDKRLATVQA